MILDKKTNYLSCIQLDNKFHQVFRNSITSSINPEVVLRMKADRQISELDLKICEFLYDVRFATFEQIQRFLKTTEDFNSTVLSRSKMDKLSVYRVTNEFILSDRSSEKYDLSNEHFRVYTLDTGGRSLVINLSNKENWWDWKISDNSKSIEQVFKELVYTELYLDLLNSRIREFRRNFMIRFGVEYFTPGVKAIINTKEGRENTFYFEVFYKNTPNGILREILRKYESIFSTNIWKKYSKYKPILILIGEDLDTCKSLLEDISDYNIDNFRFTIFEKLDKPLSLPGSLFKAGFTNGVIKEELIPVSSPYLE